METIKTGSIKIGEFNKLYTSGVIRPYENNRGGVKKGVTPMARKYANNWKTEASGIALVEKSGKHYTLRDFHNRAEAIRLGLEIGKINPEDEILIRVVPEKEGFTSYRLVNSAKNHTNIEKLKNPDLALGEQIKRVIDATPCLQAIELPHAFYRTMAAAILDVAVKPRTEFALRTGTGLMRYVNASTEEAPNLVLKKSKVGLLSDAVTYWFQTINATMDATPILRSGEYPKHIQRINNSAVFFGFLMFDFMFKRRLKDAVTTGRNLAKGGAKLARVIAHMNKGTTGECLEAQNYILEALTK